jgi:hypothetical protein
VTRGRARWGSGGGGGGRSSLSFLLVRLKSRQGLPDIEKAPQDFGSPTCDPPSRVDEGGTWI